MGGVEPLAITNQLKLTDMNYRISLNKGRRTATIREYENGKVVSKWRTVRLSRKEFESLEYFTEDDIKNYLRREELQLIK